MIFLRGADSEFIVGEKPWGSLPPTHNAMVEVGKQCSMKPDSDYLDFFTNGGQILPYETSFSLFVFIDQWRVNTALRE